MSIIPPNSSNPNIAVGNEKKRTSDLESERKNYRAQNWELFDASQRHYLEISEYCMYIGGILQMGCK